MLRTIVKEVIDQVAHWLTAFVPALLILWQPIWFVWLVLLFPLAREYYQHCRRVTVWRRDLWFAYAGIPCAYGAYFTALHFNYI